MLDNCSPEWASILAAIGMDDFSSVWAFTLVSVDNPNHGRGGWSEVGYYKLPTPVSAVKGIYVKRQEDFGSFSWRFPIRGMPTFQREYQNIKWCLERNLPVVKPVAFAVRDFEGHRQAILITQALDDYFSMDDKEIVSGLSIRLRRKLIRKIAASVKQMHDSGLQHGCLYPKHIFLNKSCQQGKSVDVRFIDLEKAERIAFWNKGIYRDLDTLNRRSYGWSKNDRICFIQHYFSNDKNAMRKIIEKLQS